MVKQPHFKADHLPPPSAEIKNQWSYSSTPAMCPHDAHRNNITCQCLMHLAMMALLCFCQP